MTQPVITVPDFLERQLASTIRVPINTQKINKDNCALSKELSEVSK